MKILIVEDEAELAVETKHFLTRYGYECEIAPSGKACYLMLEQYHFDTLILDLGLPDDEGLTVLKTVKKEYPALMVIIASARGSIEDRVLGLEDGADDYLPKPYALAELHARIQAIWRRQYGCASSVLKVGEFEVDMEKRSVRFGDNDIVLYKKEFDILSYLLLHRNRPLSRLQLYEHVWGDHYFSNVDSNYIDVHIKNIRKKLSAYSSVDWLLSVRGIGYKIVSP